MNDRVNMTCPGTEGAWEYNAYIITPSICYFVLFIMSPHSWKVFVFLAAWSDSLGCKVVVAVAGRAPAGAAADGRDVLLHGLVPLADVGLVQ